MLRKFNTLFPAVFLFGLLCAPLFGQTAAEVEELLQVQAVSYGQAARFVLEAADVASLDPQRACAYAVEHAWLPRKTAAAKPARLDGVSLLLMQAFDVDGGMWYSLTRSSHHAYRELVYQDIIQGRADPAMAVSGELLLFLINRLLSLQEGPIPAPVESAGFGEQAYLAAEWGSARTRNLALAEEINARLETLALADVSVRVTDEGVAISLSNVQFEDSAELTEAEKRKVWEIAQILKTVPQRRILVTGHTAQTGTEQNQIKTSRERAQAAAGYLVSLGVRRANEIEVRGYGSRRPIANNKTPEGMALNRRVEFTIVDERS